MSGTSILILLTIAIGLTIVLLIMSARRISKEGITVSSAPKGEHFIRSVEDVQRQHAMEHADVPEEDYSNPTDIKFGRYGFGKTVDMSFNAAVEAVTHALNNEGFGVLTDIDIAATMKKKLGKGMPPYQILGACNPQLASRAIDVEPSIGLLLPCNVVVRQDLSDAVHVECMDPSAIIGLANKPGLRELSEEVKSRLMRVIQAI